MIRIEALTQAAFAPKLAALHAQGFDVSWPASDFSNHLEMASDLILGAFIDAQLEGFILLRSAVDQAEILTLAVNPKRRRLGLGTALVKAAETSLKDRGVDILFLDVAEDNPAAAALYREAGYSGCGRRPGYYRRQAGRVAALLMQKRL